jgi:hypothetical protein
MISVREWLLKKLIGNRPLVANLNIQFMEANSHNQGGCLFVNATRGSVSGGSGLIAIGTFALRDHSNGQVPPKGRKFIEPRPLLSTWHPDEAFALQPSAYEMTNEERLHLISELPSSLPNN